MTEPGELLATWIKMANALMTARAWEEQRRSFAYGNMKLANDDITREMIDQAATKETA